MLWSCDVQYPRELPPLPGQFFCIIGEQRTIETSPSRCTSHLAGWQLCCDERIAGEEKATTLIALVHIVLVVARGPWHGVDRRNDGH